MLNASRKVRYALTAVAAIAMTALATSSQAQTASPAQTGAVRFVVTKAGFIVGAGGGTGELIFKGHRYPLTVSGLSVGATIGASTTEVVGRAYNLRQASDIAGTYTAAGSGVAVAGGVGSARLQNANGVVLDLRGRKVGFEFAANLSGVQISMR